MGRRTASRLPHPRLLRSDKPNLVGGALGVVEALVRSAAAGAAPVVRLGRYEGDIILPTLCEKAGHKRDDTRARVTRLISDIARTLGGGSGQGYVPEAASAGFVADPNSGAATGAVLEAYMLQPLAPGAGRSARTQAALIDVLTGVLSAAADGGGALGGSGGGRSATGRHRLVRKLVPAVARFVSGASAGEAREAAMRFFAALYRALDRDAESLYRLMLPAKVSLRPLWAMGTP